jgi:hypothetical protein
MPALYCVAASLQPQSAGEKIGRIPLAAPACSARHWEPIPNVGSPGFSPATHQALTRSSYGVQRTRLDVST